MMLRSLRCSAQPRAALLGAVRSPFAAFSSSADAVGEQVAAIAEKKKVPQQQQPVVETTWNTLVVGEIVDFHAHPQADRLNVCAVDVGDKDNLLQIICGALNVRQGARVPVAKVGTRLAIKEPETGELYVWAADALVNNVLVLGGCTYNCCACLSPSRKKLKIKKSKLRGEVSQGMICSEAELGLTDESDGILIFDDDAEVGGLVVEHGTIASRLKARGITVPAPQPKVTAAPVEVEPTPQE
ncbi:unnamed protein product [Phytophthora lilii]|uniref:Unnamed protein product n=1 Tax=Phytophthora lilii TaxID=2077276 RepID=A0A9W6TRP0_9STRA|nr:unnamed protein product [Phytophthora lilii]